MKDVEYLEGPVDLTNKDAVQKWVADKIDYAFQNGWKLKDIQIDQDGEVFGIKARVSLIFVKSTLSEAAGSE